MTPYKVKDKALTHTRQTGNSPLLPMKNTENSYYIP